MGLFCSQDYIDDLQELPFYHELLKGPNNLGFRLNSARASQRYSSAKSVNPNEATDSEVHKEMDIPSAYHAEIMF